MRTIVICLALGLIATHTAAQCSTAPSSDPLSLTGVTGCSIVTSCQAALCSCTGSSSTDFPTCLATNTNTCTKTSQCMAAYVTCLVTTTSTRLNSTNACSTLGSAIYVAQLAAAASTSLNSTALYQSCGYQACQLGNKTGNTASCVGDATLTATICNAATLLGTSTTLAPVSATPVVVVTLRLAGANWSAVLNDPTKKAAAITAITTDLAKLLGIDARFIVIIALSVGSLVVQFSVQDGSGKTAAQLTTAVGTATASSTWLSSTSSVYSAVGSDTISATSVAATTAAPGQTLPPNTPTPATPNTPSPTSSAMSAAGVWAVAAVAAVAALLA